MGLQTRDEGTVHLRGREVHFTTPKQALEQGIAIITQELSPVLDMDVAENIFLGREPRRLGIFVDRKRLDTMTRELLARLNFPIDPRASMRSLSLAQVQLVEIAKAISHDSEVLIMDEPTSAIGETETRKLFDTIRLLVAQGKSIIYVSHRLTEIFAVTDEFTVIRDGRTVAAGRTADVDRRGLIQHIIGGDLEHEFVKENTPTDEVLLSVRGLTRHGKFEDVSLDVRPGGDPRHLRVDGLRPQRVLPLPLRPGPGPTPGRSGSTGKSCASPPPPTPFATAWRWSRRTARPRAS